MAKAEENVGQQPPPEAVDAVQVILGNIGQLRKKLLELRGVNHKEYDRVLKQTYPLDILTLLELLAVEAGNRTAALAYRFDELASYVLPDEDDAAEDDAEGEGDDDEEIKAVRIVAEFVRSLSDLPEDVKAALVSLEKGGLWDDVGESAPVEDESKPSEIEGTSQEAEDGAVVDETPGVEEPQGSAE
jgi:hypothetical protein